MPRSDFGSALVSGAQKSGALELVDYFSYNWCGDGMPEPKNMG